MSSQKKLFFLGFLLILAFMGSQLSSIIKADYYLTGTIIDENGNGLKGVKINLYLNTQVVSEDLIGEFVANTTTNENGEFILTLLNYNYIITLEKLGYQTQTEKINVLNGDFFSWSLKKIVLSRSISFDAFTSTIEIHSGETLEIPLVIRNDGLTENISFTTSEPSDWTISILNKQGQQIQSIYLPSKSSSSISLHVIAPKNATDTDIDINVNGSGNFTKTISFKLSDTNEKFLECEYPSRSLGAGSSFDFEVEVTNPLYYDALIELGIVLNQPWRVAIENAKGEAITSIYLKSQSASIIHIRGNVPDDASPEKVTFDSKAVAGGKQSHLTFTIEVGLNTNAELNLSSRYPSQSIQLGVKTVYPLILRTGATEEFVYLSTKGVPEGWGVVFKTSDDRQINTINMQPDDSEELNVEVTPSLDSQQGVYTFTILADSNVINDAITLTANVIGSYNVKMSIDNLYLQTKATNSETVKIVITNTGYSPLNNLELDVVPPTGWDSSISPLKITTLNPNETQTFQATFSVPEGTAPQDYIISVTVVSSEISSTTQSIRVTVSVESSWAIYGVVILIIAAAIFVLIFKKLRRK
jgi:uncharacterized membrane protein